MALQVGGIDVVSNTRGLNNIASIDATTATAISSGLTGKQNADATLTALAGLNTTPGILAQTGTDTFTKRTISGTTNQITVSNGDGAAGNPTLSIATNPNLSGARLNDGYTEEVYTIVDSATVNLDPNNASIQNWTLGANRIPGQVNWATGQSITLMILDGVGRTIDWSTLNVEWKTDAGSAPTLNTTTQTVIVLWKVGTTIHGARVGDL